MITNLSKYDYACSLIFWKMKKNQELQNYLFSKATIPEKYFDNVFELKILETIAFRKYRDSGKVEENKIIITFCLNIKINIWLKSPLITVCHTRMS